MEEKGVEGKIIDKVGGLMLMGFQRHLRVGNVLFVGDAGVGTGILGNGIRRALMSGRLAAESIKSCASYPRRAELAMTDVPPCPSLGREPYRISNPSTLRIVSLHLWAL